VYCCKTVDWIRIPFGVVSGVSRGSGVLDGVVIVKGEGVVWGRGKLEHPTVTSGDFVAYAVSGGVVAFPKLCWDFLLPVSLYVGLKRYVNT